ncbi:hypothetical protein BH20GEM2_BH20GEM2_19140 [soil metagenome]|jgi:phosphoenolpyruvate carboxylase
MIRRSIQLRNPTRTAPDDETLRQALFLSINGIAAAMQSTG